MLNRQSVMTMVVLGLATTLGAADVSGPQAVRSFERHDQDVLVRLTTGVVNLHVCSDRIVHVQAAPDAVLPATASFVVTAAWKPVAFTVQDDGRAVLVRTAGLLVRVDKASGAVDFTDASGRALLSERERSFRTSPSAAVAGEGGLSQIEQVFATRPDETLHGLGQFQDGIWDWRGIPLELRQHNTVIALPMLVSSRGYGVLWDNASLTDINPIDDAIALGAPGVDAGPLPTATEELVRADLAKKAVPGSDRIGSFTTGAAGEYVFTARDGDRHGQLKVLIDNVVVAGLDNMWVPYSVSGVATLPAATTVRVALRGGGANAKLFAHLRQIDRTVFRSQAGSAIDYWFFAGSQPAEVVAAYRSATGAAPMWPRWAFGFWQCRERYRSSKHLLDTIAEFRRRQLPVDLIVQDWQSWGHHGWGAYEWDEGAYPDPKALCDGLHAMHAQLMLSVWPNPHGSAKDVLQKLPNGFIPSTDVYDPTAAETRRVRWSLLDKAFFQQGVDAWWQDAAEPLDDGNTLNDHRIALGLGNVYRNAYPLFHNRSVYEGQRAANADKRVVILTRSAFLGQQRYGAALWSGDINGTWDAFRRQIPAGLNVSMAGQPYWTTDCGGFFHPGNQHQSDDYNELWIRWFQYSTLCPIQRVHGYQSETEVWKWQPKTQEVMRAFLDLRYRLLPYIYSQAWSVTHDGAALMRPLAMDFAEDPRARTVGDAYLFGPALLVAPVTQAKAISRHVYLPRGSAWTDFWTGERRTGGTDADCPAPIERLPVQVRAGAIIPLGPTLQWAMERPADPIELRIYPGADGTASLYEDEGDSYRYEQGLYATIAFTWSDAGKSLTIGERQGSFPGMLGKRTFRIVIVRPGHGVGIGDTEQPDRIVVYDGAPLTIRL